ncbi:esterase/lipase family protein [Caldanaerobacter sp.]|uniref:esterase/lipase family protein n=1 Tax=Caldanaerobacter sp. TaxID=2930036 RepID=UPI003C7394A1
MGNPVVFLHGIFGSIFTPTPLGKIWSFGPAFYAYGPFIEELGKLGFVENKNLFVSYYEWWERIPDVVDRLILAIDEAKAKTGKNKVDLLCHSMGGLLARSYIQSDKYRDDVDKLILLGTPNLGAANAYYGWEGGTVPPDDDDLVNMLFKGFLWIFSKIKGEKDAVTIIRKYIPSVKELMPSKGYGNYIFMYSDKGERILFKDIEHMKVINDFLNDLNEKADVLYERVKEIYLVAGEGVYTNKFIQVEKTENDVIWPDGKPVGVIRDWKGDGTVLEKSALGIEGKEIVLNTSHIGLLKDSIPYLGEILGVREKPSPSFLEKAVSYLSVITDKKIVVLDRNKRMKSYDVFGKYNWHICFEPKGVYKLTVRDVGLAEFYINTPKKSIEKRIRFSRLPRGKALTLEVDEEGNFTIEGE